MRLVWIVLVVGVITKGDHSAEIEEDSAPETGNEVMTEPIDVEELARNLRKSVAFVKSNPKIEIVVVVDSSSSIGEESFKSEIKFVQKLVADFNVSPAHGRVAVIAFASSPVIHINHLQEDVGYEKCTFLHVQLPGIEYTGGNTDTIKALLLARDIFSKSRPGASRALFLITDGYSNKGDPVPTAGELKDEGIIIFTFGIQTGNVQAVRQLASSPAEEYSFVVGSFAEFEALARRALHEDLKPGAYVPLNNTGLCDRLCEMTNSISDSSCCNDQSRCSCGILTGHFACLCPPGYYGSGLVGDECKPCPRGTYHDGSTPGDVLVCLPCPDNNHITPNIPATSIEDCSCKEGYTLVGDTCEVVTCPPIVSPPTNGYFVKKNCSNVVNAACGVRCHTGYKLRGSSVRICQPDGTWSGNPPQCFPKSCKKPKPLRDGTIMCKHEDDQLELFIRFDSKGDPLENSVSGTENNEIDAVFNYTIDTECSFTCEPGYTMIGSKKRTCLPILQWNGLATTCTVVKCPSLSTLKDGKIMPDNCTTKGLRHDFATECTLSCRSGYRLEGPTLKNCTGRRGIWTGKNVPNKCIDVEPPVFTCPENITTETKEEESYALVFLELPSGTDNSGLEPIIWSKPPFLPEYPLPLKIGVTKVEIYATDASDNGDFCDFYIEVQDNEVPKVYNCESPPTFYMSNVNGEDTEVSWNEPIFTDNSVTPLQVEKSREFGRFPLGTTRVHYSAKDVSGNEVTCDINITVAENPCTDKPQLGNVEWNCSMNENRLECQVSCPEGQTWTSNNDLTNVTLTCQYDRNGAVWYPDVFSDLDAVPECSTFELPTEVVESHEIELDSKDILCDDLETLSKEVRNEISVLIGSEDLAEISITADCEDISKNTEAELDGARRKREEGRRRRIKVHVSLKGSSNNSTSREDVAKKLRKLGQKVEGYAKDPYININGKQYRVEHTKITDSAILRCSAGFALKRGLCVKCPPGTFYSAGRMNCVPCQIGKYQSEPGQSECQDCPEGYLTRRRRRKQLKDCKRICPPGTFGKIKNKDRVLALSPCTPCSVGWYQPLQGQTTCLECPSGKTTTKKGSSGLENCLDKQALEDPCYKFPCQNNGTCFVYNNFPYCLCPEGYLGSFCEKQKNYCDSSPCYNNGECIPTGVTTYICKCQDGYEGELCQYEVNECFINPCANGGECIDLLNGYKCECQQGFTGTNCEEDIDECAIFTPCLNNGSCIDLINGYNCSCPAGYGGRHCEEVSECDAEEGVVDEHCNSKTVKNQDDPCAGVHCPDNTECRISARNNYLPACYCRKGFFGVNCTEEVNFNVIAMFPKRSVTEYISVDVPPEDLHEISVCLWIQTEDNFNYGTLFSYAVNSDDNSFTITDYNGLVLYVQKQRVVTDVVANDGQWHFICVTWESKEGSWAIYLDGRIRGSGKGLSAGSAIPGGGRFIIGQEQDRFGGGFNEVESFVGKLTHFDVWKRVLHQAQIKDMNENCKYFEGDLFSWVYLLDHIRGNVQINQSNFCTHCNVRDLKQFQGEITIKYLADTIFAVYKCETGYSIRFEGEREESAQEFFVWYRKCLKHGDWEAAVPKCSRISCGFPGQLKKGNVIGNSYLYGDVLEYRCEEGFRLMGNGTRECMEDGSWSGSEPVCRGHSGVCEEISAPMHGLVRKSTISRTGDTAVFQCEPGYRLRGAYTLTCLEYDSWDNPLPTCEKISCLYPEEMRKFVVNATDVDGFLVGEGLFFQCNEFEDLRVMTCQDDGWWDQPGNVCIGKCEGKPKYPKFGLLLGDPLKYEYSNGELVYTKCRYGYRLEGDNFFVCDTSGTWHQNNPTVCQPVECVVPKPPPNSYATTILQRYPHGIRISFKCASGYKQLGELSTRCDGEGKWTKIYGKCSRSGEFI